MKNNGKLTLSHYEWSLRRGHVGDIRTLGDLVCLVSSGLHQTQAYSWAFRRIHLHALFHSFLNSPLLYYPYFQSKSIWSQTYIKQVSTYFIVKWHFMNSVCPCSHACLPHNNETSSADRHIKFSFISSFYCHDPDREKAKWHLIFFHSCLLHRSTPLAFDLWIKWRCIWTLWEQMNIIAPLK